MKSKALKEKPLWVSLTLSSVHSRTGALTLVFGNVLFTIYCIPWCIFIGPEYWIKKLFLLEDWNWFAMMIPITLWYWLSLKWIDNNIGWSDATDLPQ
jgi:hypothetical protein